MPSIVSRIFLSWVTPFIIRNTTRQVSEDELFQLPHGASAAAELESFRRTQRKSTSQSQSLATHLFWIYRKDLIILFLMTLPFITSTLANPFLLKNLIETIQGDTTFWQHLPGSLLSDIGYTSVLARSLAAALLLFINTVLIVFLIHHIFFRQLVTSIRLKLLLSAAVYEKSLKLPLQRLQTLTSGFIVNLISVDIFKITNLCNLMHSLWVHPSLVIGAMYLLYRLIGTPALIGIGAMSLAMMGSAFCTRLQAQIRKRLTVINDQRLSLTSETLTHIRSVKIMSREADLTKRISALRNQEIALSRKIMLLTSLSTLASASAPVIAMATIFLPIIWNNGTLTASQVFPALALIMSLRFALQIMPEMFLLVVESRISLTRIKTFLNYTEISPNLLDTTQALGKISIKNGSFNWNQNDHALTIPSLEIAPRELVAIIGEVGAGKTALILALLRELSIVSGDIKVNGRMAYVAQQPWLISDTIKKNIICENSFDNIRYQRALELSDLKSDLATFPSADLTEIGERGITLSGGQRQRLALARAYYRDADIILLDDPLSALDNEVADHVFSELISSAWQAKTRILVTHRLEYALKAKRVILIEQGEIIADGPPQLIIANSLSAQALFAAHESSSGNQQTVAHENIDSDFSDQESSDKNLSINKTISIEDRESGAVQKDIIKRYLLIFSPGLIPVALLAIFILRQSTSAGLDLWWAFFSSSKAQTMSSFVFGLVGLSLLVCCFNFMRAYWMLQRGLSAGRDVHRKLLEGILHAPLQFFESNPVGRILNRFSRDLETIDSGLPRSLLDLFICGFDVLTTITIILYLQPLGIVVIGPVLILYFYLQKMFRPTSRELRRLDSVSRSPIFALLSESLRGVETLRAFQIGAAFNQHFSTILDQNGRALYSLTATNRWLGLRLESLGTMITLTAAMSACFFEHSALGAALGGFALTYAIAITGSMNWFVRMVAQTESDLTSFERIDYYANQKPERWHGVTPRATWPDKGEISLQSVSVRYRKNLPLALNSISAKILAGERIGIVGRTGSGKSTLTQALFRLRELDSGHIHIDGIDISTIDLRALRQALTMIPQEPALFSGTIREHLDADQKYSDQELYQILERVELRDFVETLPQGLLTQISEGGNNFSAGQRQLLCLALAILKGNKVIILDEATAHVDPKCDLAIQKTIREEFSLSTQIIIAHRLGTVMDCDRIFVFSAGKLIKTGTPQEVFEEIGASDIIT
jgi:ABC-type multidrug transport system fused ATPase/permease subunit